MTSLASVLKENHRNRMGDLMTLGRVRIIKKRLRKVRFELQAFSEIHQMQVLCTSG